jgi:putative membrane protein
MTTKRLHPLAILLFWWRDLAGLAFIFVISASGLWHLGLFWFLLVWGSVIALDLVRSVVKYWWYRYDLGEQAITINTGIIFKKQVHVPYTRIQTLQLKQWFFMRPFKLTSVSLETSGQSHDKAEGELPMVTQTVVDQLQALVKGQPVPGVTAESASETSTQATPKPIAEPTTDTTYRINWSDLNTYALTSMGVIPILLGVLWLYDKLDDLVPDKVLNNAVSNVAALGILMLVGLILVILIFGIIVSYLTIIQRYYHFQLSKQGQRLVTEKGFFQRNTISANESRVQTVIVSQTILRQLLKLESIQLVLASSASEKEDGKNLVLMPVLNQRRYAEIHRFINWVPQERPVMERISFSGRWRLIRNALLVALVPAVPIIWFLRPWGWLALLLVPLAIFLGIYAGHNVGLSVLSDQLVALQTGHWFERETYLVPKRRIQSVVLVQTIWMKRAGLAHLRLNVRHGDSNQEIEVRFVSDQAAQRVYDWYRQAND